MKRYLLPLAAGIAVAVAGIAVAQDAGNGAMSDKSTMPQMTRDMPAPSDSPATRAFKEAKLKMMNAMQIAYTGNPDVDYVRGMMAHHQGAVDMAKVHLKFGKDPEMLKLSRDIVGSQETQIAQMKEWLAKHAP